MNTLEESAWLLVVAAMWGATNPLIKKGSKGVELIKEDSAFSQFLAEFQFLFFNIKYLIPFLLNQMGSVLYYIMLSSTDLSLAVPLTNSLTFIFTSLSGRILGEKPESYETLLGLFLVVCGVVLCVYSKS
ncbi:transmembrane protein 234 homolog isoform X1 [Pomacea canaliculata]|uniref:transmembrane protein 234 homolog isoform X1 n=1 Tax=Pomacea canaliculata TaxID=400727 RepID=UPI000D72C7C9|nr:transmembrane protein 234 homolog isoform X1 [Pomacea canaliculata]